MKDLGKTKYYLSLQIEHCSNGILIHQSTYIEKVLKRFYMDKSHPLNSPMVLRSLKVNKDLFCPKEENKELFGPKVPYLSAIGALMYHTNCIRPNITFLITLLARYNSALTRRHYSGIKPILRYFRGTSDCRRHLLLLPNQIPDQIQIVKRMNLLLGIIKSHK